MPRPRKFRKVCCMPKCQEFIPLHQQDNKHPIILTVDEYEAVRLIDKESFSQEESSAYMHIARTTVQQIYTNARKKIATALVDGCALRIEGGDYKLCDGLEHQCGCGGCKRHRCQQHPCEQTVDVVEKEN